MEDKNFKKVDAKKIVEIHTKAKCGATAKMHGIIMLLVGAFLWIIIPFTFNADSSFSDESGKYTAAVLLFCMGLIPNIMAVIFLRRHFRHRKFVRLLFEKGLLTKGSVVESKHKPRGKGWDYYKISYTYTDDKGTGRNEKIEFVTMGIQEYEPGQRISIAFYEGVSAIVVERWM